LKKFDPSHAQQVPKPPAPKPGVPPGDLPPVPDPAPPPIENPGDAPLPPTRTMVASAARTTMPIATPFATLMSLLQVRPREHTGGAPRVQPTAALYDPPEPAQARTPASCHGSGRHVGQRAAAALKASSI